MPFLVLDLEMTGGEAGYHDIIQIGAVLADDQWNLLGKFETLVYPDNEATITSAAEEIHGISLYDLEDAPTSDEAIENFEAWIRTTLKIQEFGSLKRVMVCGQSIMNDVSFLMEKYRDLNIQWPFDFRLLDLMSMSFLMYQVWDHNKMDHPKSYSLKAVASHFGLERAEDQHNALEDAILTYKCFKKYFEQTKKLTLT